jgi:hypothetical protein
VASALSPPGTGKVLLLTVVNPDATENGTDPVAAGQEVLGRAIRASLEIGHRPEALLSVASDPWKEISRVASEHGCGGLLLGRADSEQIDEASLARLENVMNDVDCDVSFLQTPPGWALKNVRRVLVPIGGRSRHQVLRIRLLGSLARGTDLHVVWIRVMPPDATDAAVAAARRDLEEHAQDTARTEATVIVERSADYVNTVAEHSGSCDLLVLGLDRDGGRRVFGAAAPKIALAAKCATIIISRGN